MTWTKLPDEAPDELWALSDGAFRLHLHGQAYANRLLTDGYVPAARLDTLTPHYEAAQLDELVRVGLWAPEKDGYRIVYFLVDQPSRATVLARRKANTERIERWRKEHGNGVTGGTTEEHGNGVTGRSSNGVGNGVGNATIDPVPSRPVLRRTTPKPPSRKGAANATRGTRRAGTNARAQREGSGMEAVGDVLRRAMRQKPATPPPTPLPPPADEPKEEF